MDGMVDGPAAGLDGDLSAHWAQEPPGIPRVAKNVPNRVERLRGIGNAVVPQVAELIGRMIMAHEFGE